MSKFMIAAAAAMVTVSAAITVPAPPAQAATPTSQHVRVERAPLSDRNVIELFTGQGRIIALFLVAAVGSAFARDRRKGRIACAVTAGFIATVAISWLMIAGVAASIVAPAAWWALLAGPAWAVVPYWLLRIDKEAP